MGQLRVEVRLGLGHAAVDLELPRGLEVEALLPLLRLELVDVSG